MGRVVCGSVPRVAAPVLVSVCLGLSGCSDAADNGAVAAGEDNSAPVTAGPAAPAPADGQPAPAPPAQPTPPAVEPPAAAPATGNPLAPEVPAMDPTPSAPSEPEPPTTPGEPSPAPVVPEPGDPMAPAPVDPMAPTTPMMEPAPSEPEPPSPTTPGEPSPAPVVPEPVEPVTPVVPTPANPGPAPTGGCDVVCDDFEAAELDLTKWDYLGRNENNIQMTPVLDTSKKHSGNQSITIPGGLNRGMGFYPIAGLPTANNKVYVRAYMLFDTPTDQLMGHSAFIIAADKADNGGEVRLGFSQPPAGPSVMIDVNIQNVQGIGGEITQFSNGYVTGYNPIPEPGRTLDADTWYCVEMLFNGEDHELQLWIDDAAVSHMHVTDWSPEGDDTKLPKADWSPSYNFVRFAPQRYSGGPGQVWFDDIAISNERVGCSVP